MEELMTTFNMDQLSGMLVGGILAVGAIGSVVSFVMSILSIIGGWKMFRKFGEPGWKVIIPFYGTWVEYQYTWKPIMMIPVVLLGVGGGILMNMAEEGTALQMIASAVFLVGWVLNIIAYYKRCKAFGHGMITSCKPMGGDILLEITFDKVGTKRLMAKSAMNFMTKK